MIPVINNLKHTTVLIIYAFLIAKNDRTVLTPGKTLLAGIYTTRDDH
jgi:hypothetical protein